MREAVGPEARSGWTQTARGRVERGDATDAPDSRRSGPGAGRSSRSPRWRRWPSVRARVGVPLAADESVTGADDARARRGARGVRHRDREARQGRRRRRGAAISGCCRSISRAPWTGPSASQPRPTSRRRCPTPASHTASPRRSCSTARSPRHSARSSTRARAGRRARPRRRDRRAGARAAAAVPGRLESESCLCSKACTGPGWRTRGRRSRRGCHSCRSRAVARGTAT